MIKLKSTTAIVAAWSISITLHGASARTTAAVGAVETSPKIEQSCSIAVADPRTVNAVPDPVGFAPGGTEDRLTAPTEELKPANPVMMTCEHGRIVVKVETKRFHTYHLGDEIPISIKIVADNSVQLDFSSLEHGTVGLEGSDFDLIPGRVIDIASRAVPKDHVTIYSVNLAVQSFVTKPMLAFNADMQYAVDVPSGTKQPNWHRLTTPDLVISTSPVVVDNDDELGEGDLGPVDARHAWVTWPLLVGGSFMIVWWGFLRRLVVRMNRKRPGRQVPANESAWLVLDKVFSDAREYGEFGAQYLRKVDAALRRYLAQRSNKRIEALSIRELKTALNNHARLPTIVSVLEKCESVLYARADQAHELSQQQIDELHRELETLIPKPEKE